MYQIYVFIQILSTNSIRSLQRSELLHITTFLGNQQNAQLKLLHQLDQKTIVIQVVLYQQIQLTQILPHLA